jgi:hypothetical protein
VIIYVCLFSDPLSDGNHSSNDSYCDDVLYCGASVKWVPVVLGLGGIAIESIADAQKSRFRYVFMQYSILSTTEGCAIIMHYAVSCAHSAH